MTTKIHATVDGLGNPVRIRLTGGEVHDIVPAVEMIDGISADYILADRAYDADQFISFVNSQDAQIVCPPKRNRKKQRDYDRHLYKERHLVECFFAKIKSYRRVATRYEKLARNFNAAVLIAACMVWLH